MMRSVLFCRPTRTLLTAFLLFAFVATSGCASKGFVRRELATTDERLGDVQGQVEANQDRLVEHDEELARQDGEIAEVDEATKSASKTAREALGRAIEAGKLAEGKLLFESVLSDDQVRFGFDKADLGDEAKEALTAFAAQLTAANENIFIEIQGHTDATGSETYNLELGETRAEAVRRELNRAHGLPLHRMSVISYGESEPVDDNGTRDGRSRNRRVVLVVLK